MIYNEKVVNYNDLFKYYHLSLGRFSIKIQKINFKLFVLAAG
jgi:hypothetical protein